MGGVVGFNWEDRSLAKRMSLSSARRGTGEQIFSDSGLTIGVRSNSEIKQPFSNESGDIFLFCDGILLNPEEIKARLTQEHMLRTTAPAELLLHAYEEFGEQVLNYANITSFVCIYDKKKKSLVIARDRIGISPLYYHFINGHLVFASELKSVLEVNTIKREIDKRALNYYLLLGFNPLEETLVAGVKKLFPGYFLKLDLNEKTIITSQYWALQNKIFKGSIDEFEERAVGILKDCLKREQTENIGLVLDGLDSLLLISLLTELNKEDGKSRKITTFSLNFANTSKKELDEERAYAEKLTKLFGTEHKEFLITPELLKFIPEAMALLDEPIADPEIISSMLLFSGAKSTVDTIALVAGSEELFLRKKEYSQPGLHGKNLLARIFGKKHEANEETPIKNFISQSAIFNEDERKEILTKEFYDKIDIDTFCMEFVIKEDPLREAQLFDIKKSIPAKTLSLSSSFIAENAMELTAPFLDYRYAEAAFGVETKEKKDSYKALVQKRIPKEFSLPDKSRLGFEKIIGKEFKPEEGNILNITRIYKKGMLNPYYAKKIIADYNSGKKEYARQIFSLICFEHWHRIFIEREK